jgi:hypothetical protein
MHATMVEAHINGARFRLYCQVERGALMSGRLAPKAADQRSLFDRHGTTFVAMIWRSLRSPCQERSFHSLD